MAGMFERAKSSAQLKTIWAFLAAELSRCVAQPISAQQCKSKLKHMHKQYTAFRTAQQETGNQTELALYPLACFQQMCDAFGQCAGLSADMLFSSDVARDPSTQDDSGALEREVQLDDTSDAPSTPQPARGHALGKRKRQGNSVVKAMHILRDGLSDVADAYKQSSGDQRNTNRNEEILLEIRELAQSVREQAMALTSLINI